MAKFDMIKGVHPQFEIDESLGIIEGTRKSKAETLNDILVSMRWRFDKYQGATDTDILNDLLDIMINSVEY